MTESRSLHRTRTVLLVLFAIYLLELAWTVIWKLEVPYIGAAALLPRPFKWVPFVASGDAGASAPLEVLANILLFVPFGLFLGSLAPRFRWWSSTAVFLGASFILELTQHLLSVGSFDITDVIVNTVGGVAGLGLLVAVRSRLRSRAFAVLTRAALVWTVLSLVAIPAYVASPFHYEQPRDVIYPRSD